MKLKRYLAKPEHEVAYQDLCALISKNNNITSLELLAVASNMLGKLIALQDQRVVTQKEAIDLVLANIEYGNNLVLDGLLDTKGSA